MSARPVVVGLGEILWDVYPTAEHFGGAPANVAMHASQLGAESHMVSAVGADPHGDRARDALAAAGVGIETVQRAAAHATGMVLVTLDAEGRASYDIAADRAWDHVSWTPALAALASRTNAVCFGTLGQRHADSRDAIRQFVAATPANALRVFDVNLRQQFYDRDMLEASFALVNAVKLNDEELPIVATLCGLSGSTERELIADLRSRYDVDVVALTSGPRGSLLVAGSEFDEAAVPPIIPVDTVGAGDSFTATMILGMLAKRPLSEINQRANAVAAYVCQQPGATPVLAAHLRAFA